MNARFAVRNFKRKLNEISNAVFVYCIGYETRSRHAAEQGSWAADNVIAVEYSESQILSFEENRAYAKKCQFRIVSDLEPSVEQAIAERIENSRAKGMKASIAIDVSSMDRSLMARVLFAATDKLKNNETLVVLYSPSRFTEPTRDLVPIRALAAAHPELSGQVAPPDTSRIVLLGIGYEYGVSLNILETHEPDIAFIFRPNGIDPSFSEALLHANFGFDFGDRNYDIVDYYLDDMAGAYDDISNLMATGKHGSSIVSVPMGPKILSAVMILAGRLHKPHVSVLRYSVARVDNYVDAHPAGAVLGITVTILKREIDEH
ncbi:hypothetical protein [Tardiphaga sp.]|jgi:hypothetical protein|uniref:hypothetical protein n=1 Tax=Tardiphaga sp. TaxID=1926292 RepID=UPI0037DA7345